MKYRTLLEVRDDLILQKLLESFPENDRLELKAVFKQKMEQASSEWESETVGLIVPAHAKNQFFKTMDRNFDPK